MFKPLLNFLGGAMKASVWGLLGVTLMLALVSCSAPDEPNDHQHESAQTEQREIMEDLKEHIATEEEPSDPPTTIAKQMRLYPDLPKEIEAAAKDYYCYVAGSTGTFIRMDNAVYLYKNEELLQEWGRGALPEQRALIAQIDKNIYLVEDNELIQLKLDGTTELISDEVLDADMPYAGCVRALYFQNGALIWWSHNDYGAGTTLVADELEDIEAAGFGCSSVLVTMSDGTYVWLKPTFEGEFNEDQIYTFCKIGGPQSIKYWREVWNGYATFFTQAPCLSEFIAYCTTPMYSAS